MVWSYKDYNMFYLIITILLNTLIFSIFKIFSKYKIDILQAVVVNYATCVVTGSIFLGRFPISSQSLIQPWFPWAVLMGTLFISLFSLIAWRTKEDGMTTTTIANKLSLVIPVLFAVFLFQDKLQVTKIAGIILAFPAIYFTTRVKDEHEIAKRLFYPTLLFFGSGLLDTLVTYVQYYFLPTSETQAAYTVHAFAIAAVLGIMVVGYLKLKGIIAIRWQNIIAGVALGIPNFFSIYFLIKLLHSGFLESSAAIPVNNIGIVVTSSLVAIFFFHEKVTSRRVLGLLLAIISIFLIALSNLYG